MTDSVCLRCPANSSRENFSAGAEKDRRLFQIPCLFIRWIGYLQADLETRQGFRTVFFKIGPIVCPSPRKRYSINLVTLWGEIPFMRRPSGRLGSGRGIPPPSTHIAFPRQDLICLQHPGHLLGLPSSLQCLIMVCLANSSHCMFILSWKLDRIKLRSKALTNYCWFKIKVKINAEVGFLFKNEILNNISDPAWVFVWRLCHSLRNCDT